MEKEEVEKVIRTLNSITEEEMEHYRNTPEFKRFLDLMTSEALPKRKQSQNNLEQKKQDNKN